LKPLVRLLGFALLPVAFSAAQSCGGSDFSSGLDMQSGGSGGMMTTETSCTSSKMCPADQVCDTDLHECVECVSDRDCAGGDVCFASECRPACESSDDCAEGTCDEDRGICIECSDDDDCKQDEYCSEAGECHADECEPGETKCGEDEFLACAENGSGFESSPCEVCSESGKAHCVIGGSGGAGNGDGGTGNQGGAGGGGNPQECAENDGNPCQTLPAFSGDQVMDAKADDFCEVPGYELNLESAGYISPNDATGDSSAIIRAAWSDNTLRVHVAVTDPVLHTGPAFYDGDVVQFFVSGYTPVTGPVDGTTDGGANQIFIRPSSNGSGDISVVRLTDAIYDYATRVTEDGYEVEFAWTWPVAVAQSSVVGFNVIIGVNDNPDVTDREYEYGIDLVPVNLATPCSEYDPPDLAAWCDDRTWCTPTLE
jgi:hypothetical protein